MAIAMPITTIYDDWKEVWLVCIRSDPGRMHQLIRQDPHTVLNPAGKRVWEDDRILWKVKVTPEQASWGLNRLIHMYNHGELITWV